MKEMESTDIYTTVVGVDEKHLCQLRLVWPTWKRHKSSLLESPMIIFFDPKQVDRRDILRVVDHPDLRLYSWPPDDVEFEKGHDKWTDSQRCKMLSGFVHIASEHVETRYWLKLDTDTVATERSDWINPRWFIEEPGIVAQPWGYTKPPDQIVRLDDWVELHKEQLQDLACFSPLDLKPLSGASRITHPRIISWCGFFNTSLTRCCARWAEKTMGRGHLPVSSQDGYMWYCATRLKMKIHRVSMKDLGWQHWCTMTNIEKHSREALNDG